MEINNNKITLDYLINKSKIDGFYKGDYDKFYEFQLLQVVNILIYCPDFKKYLESKNYQDSYTWTYFIFGSIPRYVETCYNKRKNKEIYKIFNFLDKMSESKEESIDSLLCVGCLEVFDNHKKIIPDIVEMMPKNLYELFMKYYSDYLK